MEKEPILNIPTGEEIDQNIQRLVDEFHAYEFVEYNREAREKAFNDLTRSLIKKEGYDPDNMDVNYQFNQNKTAAELEVVDFIEDKGLYVFELIIRNKFTEGEEDKPKMWQFRYEFTVSPEILQKSS